MRVFVDTSAIFAGIDTDDAQHEAARDSWASLLRSGGRLETHAMVEIEAFALLQKRLGVDGLDALRALLPRIEVAEVERDRRRAAFAEAVTDRRRSLSIVDRVSFGFMRDAGITHAFAFDRHFAEAGFELIGAEAA